MFINNAIKVARLPADAGELQPLAVVCGGGPGRGDALPAKYGVLTELLPSSRWSRANGWIEGLTIASIILGVLLGASWWGLCCLATWAW